MSEVEANHHRETRRAVCIKGTGHNSEFFSTIFNECQTGGVSTDLENDKCSTCVKM